jgi:hypothetical protein
MGLANMSMVFERFLAETRWFVGSFIKHRSQDGAPPEDVLTYLIDELLNTTRQENH